MRSYDHYLEKLKEVDEINRSFDPVNNPAHYNQTSVECIDGIQAATNDGFEFYLQGNIMKYVWRYRYKNGLEDLEKARWYLDKLIEVYDEG